MFTDLDGAIDISVGAKHCGQKSCFPRNHLYAAMLRPNPTNVSDGQRMG